MGHATGGFGGYRGRKSLHDVLKIIVGILGAMVVVVMVALFFGQDYILYTESGLRLNLPFFQNEEVQSAGDISVTLEIDEPAPPEEPEEPETPPVMSALQVTLDSIQAGSAAAELEQAGANAIVLDMKTDQGQLGWVSAHEMAVNAQANHLDPSINQRLRGWNQGEIYTVARLSAFRDQALSQDKSYCIRTNSDYRWVDNDGIRWISPTVEQVQDYLVALMVELAELGFDEILLDNCGYPAADRGKMGYIKHGAAYRLDSLSTVLGSFLDKAYTALAPYDTVLSVRVRADALTGEDERTGQTPALLEQYAQRMWMLQDPENLPLLEGASITDPPARLVEVVSAFAQQGDRAQAILQS